MDKKSVKKKDHHAPVSHTFSHTHLFTCLDTTVSRVSEKKNKKIHRLSDLMKTWLVTSRLCIKSSHYTGSHCNTKIMVFFLLLTCSHVQQHKRSNENCSHACNIELFFVCLCLILTSSQNHFTFI